MRWGSGTSLESAAISLIFICWLIRACHLPMAGEAMAIASTSLVQCSQSVLYSKDYTSCSKLKSIIVSVPSAPRSIRVLSSSIYTGLELRSYVLCVWKFKAEVLFNLYQCIEMICAWTEIYFNISLYCEWKVYIIIMSVNVHWNYFLTDVATSAV